jgi:hypothetical protein
MLTKQTVALGGKGSATGKAVGWKTIAGGGHGAAIGSSMGIPCLMPLITMITVGGVGYWLYHRYHNKKTPSAW